jgi:hypothetical protein
MTPTTSKNHELSTPLLSNLLPHESDADAYDEEHCMPCSLKIDVGDDEEEESDDDSSQFPWWFDSFLSLVVPPALLFLQFGMAFFHTSGVDADMKFRWYMANYSIVMFVVIAALYRQTIQDFEISCLVARLLPEILMDIVLGLVLYDQVVPAFLFLLSSMLCMAIFVVAGIIRVFVVAIASTKGDCDEVSQIITCSDCVND